MNKYLFGTAYYDEYMPYDRLETDFKMMKEAGFNVVRIAESTWSTLEPKENVFDFTHIDRVLNAAEKYGLSVIIGTPTYAVPYWLVQLDRDVLVTTSGGRSGYGYRQNMDITNKTYLHHAEIVIRKLLEHTAKHPNVIGFQIDNETHHYGNVGKSIQAKFKQYMINKFKTTDAMNKAFGLAYWSNSIADWDDFPDITAVQNASLGCAFEEFRRQCVADFLSWQADIVKEYKRDDQFITHNLDYDWESIGPAGHHDGNSRGLQANADHFENNKCLTIAGVDVYHKTQKHFTGMEIAFAGSEIYALNNAPYFVLETQAQAFPDTLPFPKQMKLHAMMHISSGAKGILYWNWHSIHNAKETYWKGILSHDLEPNPTYYDVCEIGKELKNIAPEICNMKKKNRVAIVVDNDSYGALKWFPIHKDLSYNDVVLKIYKVLYEMNIECDIVFAKALDFDRYDLVITPALYSVRDELIEALRAYTENGGVLFSTFKSFVTDKNVKVFHDRLPHGMTDVFGLTYNQHSRTEDVTVNGENAEYFMELLKSDTAETIYNYQHYAWCDYSAFCRNKFGKGTAYYLGYVPNDNQLKALISMALIDAKIEKPEYEFPIVIKKGYTDDKRIEFIFNCSVDRQEYVTDNDCIEIKTGKSISKNTKITLEPWESKIFFNSCQRREYI
ncbi:MAG: beta-galactosidase [Eubacterium sp.]